jgi:type I restriction enzyme, S subunit
MMNKWNTVRLGDILDICHGKNQRDVERSDGRYPILGTGGIIGRTNSFLCDKPSVLIGRKGTIDRPQYMETPFWTIDTLFYTTISEHAIPRYIFYVFCSINWQQYNAATGVPSLAASTIESIKIPLPPLAEQRKIAEILRTWDEAIETAEAELKAKQERKRGLMLKCLAPAIEAKGANGWRTVRLGEICNPQQWTTIGQSQMTATGIPVYGANSFIGFFSESNHEGDVIAVSCRGSCGEVAFVAGPSYVTGNSMCLDDISSDEVDIYWLYQCLKLRGFRDIISGSAQPQIIRKDVIKVKISMPPLPVQKKTAEVLLSADHDIETINNRIEALCAQKRGLMQRLLTGEVRVAA